MEMMASVRLLKVAEWGQQMLRHMQRLPTFCRVEREKGRHGKWPWVSFKPGLAALMPLAPPHLRSKQAPAVKALNASAYQDI